ncbi:MULTISPECIES: carboxymuconolactone decarboxylase family protein [unclassified Isoptericola]|uniref:carboxymuconolactone decarboxylase family protein n=1 Tax=unclassified Isoptericola TaxID=2623355 RepID=UPI00365E6343
MTIIRTVEPDDATGALAEVYAEDVAALGYVPSHTRVMAVDLEAYLAFEGLARAVARGLGPRLYELVTLAAAKALRSEACLLAHGRRSRQLFDDAQLARIARDHHDAGLTDAEVAAMDLAARLSTDAVAVTEAETRRLRDAGLTDRQIVDVALAAGLRNYYSRSLQALAVPPDVPPDLPDALRQALLDGGAPGPAVARPAGARSAASAR